MKLTKATLKRLIKEELDAMQEASRSEVETMTQDYASRIRRSRSQNYASRFSDEEVEDIVRDVIQGQIDSGKSTRYTRVAGLVNHKMYEIVTRRSREAVKHIPKSHLGKDGHYGPSGIRTYPGGARHDD